MHSSDTNDKRVVLGRLGKTHGIKGWLKLHSFTSPPENILDYKQLWARNGDDWQVLEIDEQGRTSGDFIIHLKGIDDPEAARRYTGRELAVDAGQLPSLERGSYYWHELEGMIVTNCQGELLGEVERMLETGANDVLVVKPTARSIDDRERLIPFITEAVIKEVDREDRIILVDWQADYLE